MDSLKELLSVDRLSSESGTSSLSVDDDGVEWRLPAEVAARVLFSPPIPRERSPGLRCPSAIPERPFEPSADGCVRRLAFRGAFFIRTDDGTSMIVAIRGEQTTICGQRVAPPFLLVYGREAGGLVWKSPLGWLPEGGIDPTRRICDGGASGFGSWRADVVGSCLCLWSAGRTMHFLDPKNGKINLFCSVPDTVHPDGITHICPSGYMYHLTKDRGYFVGMRFVWDEMPKHMKCEQTFSSRAFSGDFYPLSTHCGFLDRDSRRLVVFGPNGVCEPCIENCLDVCVQDRGRNTPRLLYGIQTKDTGCFVTAWRLDPSSRVLPELQNVRIGSSIASLVGVCGGGWVVVLLGESGSVAFVDMESGIVKNSGFASSSLLTQYVISDSGELWAWDRSSKKAWKITPEGGREVKIENARSLTTLVHIDENSVLYFH
jgi:hypothetical protein